MIFPSQQRVQPRHPGGKHQTARRSSRWQTQHRQVSPHCMCVCFLFMSFSRAPLVPQPHWYFTHALTRVAVFFFLKGNSHHLQMSASQMRSVCVAASSTLSHSTTTSINHFDWHLFPLPRFTAVALAAVFRAACFWVLWSHSHPHLSIPLFSNPPPPCITPSRLFSTPPTPSPPTRSPKAGHRCTMPCAPTAPNARALSSQHQTLPQQTPPCVVILLLLLNMLNMF